QCPATGALVKSRKISVAPALPNTAEFALQLSAVHWARTRIVTGLVRFAPHFAAAAVNTFRRCCPRVVPEFPPTGAVGVGSLKPTLAESALTMVMVAAPCKEAGAKTTQTSNNPAQYLFRIARRLRCARSYTPCRCFLAGDFFGSQGSVGRLGHDR